MPHHGELCWGQLPLCEPRKILTHFGGWEEQTDDQARASEITLLHVYKWLHIVVWTSRKSIIKHTLFQIKGSLILPETSVILYPKSLTSFTISSNKGALNSEYFELLNRVSLHQESVVVLHILFPLC